MGKYNYIVLLSFLITYGVTKRYPGVGLQWIVAYCLWWLGAKIVIRTVKPTIGNQRSIRKWIIGLSIFGLLGLISPIVGFVFALPSSLLANYSIADDNLNKTKLRIFAYVVLTVCVLNANYGTIMYSQLH